MLEINLIPKEERKGRHNIPVGPFSIILVFAGLIVVMILLYLNNMRVINKLNGDLAKVTEDKKRYVRFDQEYQALNNQLKEIDKKFQILSKLDKGRTFAPKLMEDVLIRLPLNTWLLSFDLNRNNLRIQGSGMNNYLISDFAESLERSEFFQSIEIGEVKEKKEKIGDQDTLTSSFELSCTIKPDFR
ncbi:MAG TPA: PilN domain-containing protein [Candidatus Mcinerneyibacteriales bacterium]|nr:PilN domain-containing protein [Candidatus Mcinerneyibacteriales bacterium]HPE19742.1 PilN domain-containing protein [Candidatus Mcinerneyibacteriales bacterium]HPJ69312.1 PilN domain-containing protein [Candidatus Mcinerneyibacteriales bacterium]